MTRKIELLAPGGDIEAVKAAIVAGANAVYCGLDLFNARNRASNLSIDELGGAIRLAHDYNCEVFLTLNIVILEHEIPTLIRLLNKIVNSGIDGIILQDLGVFNIVTKYFPTLEIHASTQMTTHNEGQVLFLNELGTSRLNLSRELNLPEITSLTTLAHKHDVKTEVFVHGALCVAFSGQCYSSSVSVGNSGNRGRCSQGCRDEYEKTPSGSKYPLNLKDNSAYFDLPELVAAQVDSLKVEGRIKGAHYVYTVIDAWRKQIDSFNKSGTLLNDDSNLHKVFNRSFTNSFLTGKLTENMFIDNPRDYSAKHAIKSKMATSTEQIEKARTNLYHDRNLLGKTLAEKVKDLRIDKENLTITFTAKLGLPLIVTATTQSKAFVVKSSLNLTPATNSSITKKDLEQRFKSFNNSTYSLNHFDFTPFNENLSVPFQEVTAIKKQLAFLLNNSIDIIPPTELVKLSSAPKEKKDLKLSILISNEADAHLCKKTDTNIYFKLPESFKKGCTHYKNIFLTNPHFIPWFPAILIGKDYTEAVHFLEVIRPKKIVSNNTGIGYKAFKMGIEWIAGPLLNTTNSHALITLKEKANCAGAFISNEINRNQIKNIRRPKNFKLIYSIYHPILMMTSRQCFFQRTVGCNKPSIDDACMLSCEKATTITNVKGTSFYIDKQKGGYPSIYNHEQFLNLDIVRDLPELFDEFFIDLSEIGPGEKKNKNKEMLIEEFDKFLADPKYPKDRLDNMVEISTNAQYRQGL